MKTATLLAKPGSVTKPKGATATVAFLVGGALLIWLSYIHVHLWQDGYRHIGTIGPLFLLQSIAGLVIGLLIIAVRRVWIAIGGAGFALATMAGFLISVEHGLFGFTDSWSAPFAHVAFVLEIVAAAVLLVAAILSFKSSSTASR
jgi:hypothetical protein